MEQGQKFLVSGRIYKEDGTRDFTIVHEKELIFNRIVEHNEFDSPNDRVFGFFDEDGKEIGFFPDDIFQLKNVE